MSPFRHRPMADRPLSCRQVGRVLQRYLDGELDDVGVHRVAEHLEDCRRCGMSAEVYEQIKASLARQAPEVPDVTLARLRRFSEQLVAGGRPGDAGDDHPSDGNGGAPAG